MALNTLPSYSVRSGDSLWGIAKKFSLSLEELLEANPHKKDNPGLIEIGESIFIPVESFTYTIQSGDTLSAIARRYGTTVTAIQNANPEKITHIDQIEVNDRILIPLSTSAISSDTPGDTTSRSAVRFGSADSYISQGPMERVTTSLPEIQTPDAESTLDRPLETHSGTRRPDARSSSEDVFQYIFDNNYLEGDSLATIHASASLTKYYVKNIKKDFGEHNAELFYTLLNTGYMDPRVYREAARSMDRMFDKLGFGNIFARSERTTVVMTVLNAFLFQETDQQKRNDELNSDLVKALLSRYNSDQWNLGNCDVWSHILKYHLTRLGIETSYARGFAGKNRAPSGLSSKAGFHLWLTFVDDHGEMQNIESTNLTLVNKAYFTEQQYSLVGTSTLFSADGVARRANDFLKETKKTSLNDELFRRHDDMRAQALRGLALDPKNFPLHIHFASLSAKMAVYSASHAHGKNKKQEAATFNKQSLDTIFSGLESLPKNESRNFMLDSALDIAFSTARLIRDTRPLTQTLFRLFRYGNRRHDSSGDPQQGWALRRVIHRMDLMSQDHQAMTVLKLYLLQALADALREDGRLLSKTEQSEFLNCLKPATDPDSLEQRARLSFLEDKATSISQAEPPSDLGISSHVDAQ